MNLRSIYRITAFVPADSVPALRRALEASGMLSYGNYSNVLWQSAPGEESFMPQAGTTPTIGVAGEATSHPSTQVVFSIPVEDRVLEQVMEAIRSVHPWEEPVVFVDSSSALSSDG